MRDPQKSSVEVQRGAHGLWSFALLGIAWTFASPVHGVAAQVQPAASGIHGLTPPPARAGARPVPSPWSPPSAASDPVAPLPDPSLANAAPSPPAAYQNGNPQPAGEVNGRGLPVHMATRLRVLDNDFQLLARNGTSGTVNGVLSVVSGGLSITLGLVVDDPIISPYLYVFGGSSVARGIAEIALSPDPSKSAIAFVHMPSENLAQAQRRLKFGELELEHLAKLGRWARFMDGTISLGTAVAIVPAYLGPNDYQIDTFGAFMLIAAGISAVTGLLEFVTSSEAERRWKAYSQLRSNL